MRLVLTTLLVIALAEVHLLLACMRRSALTPSSLPRQYATGLVHAYANGNISLAQARTLLANALRIRFRLGLFDDPADQPYDR